MPRERAASCVEPFREYLAARFGEDAHVDGTVLYREVVGLGFDRSYVTFVRELRLLGLRPRCEACCTGGHGVTTVIAHEPGGEIQWDWLELHETPWGAPAYVLVGALSFSGKCRAVVCEGQSFAHLVEAIDGVLRRLGGTSRAWRTDRMATVVHQGGDRITAAFAQVAKHYGVEVWVCPARRPQRKGVVEAAIKYITRSWWRTAPVASLGQAQADLDRWAVAVSDRRKRQSTTIGELAAQENLLALPAIAFPALLEVQRVVSRTAMIAFEGNSYSVPPGLVGQTVTVRARSGELHLEILSPAGRRLHATGELPPALDKSCRAASMRGCSSGRCSRRSRPQGPALASKTGHPASRRSPPPPACAATRTASSSTSISTRGSRGSPVNRGATYQQLRSHLAYLKLTALAEQLPAALEQAEKNKPGYTTFLHDLLDVEVTATEQRRLQRRLRFANFPHTKTLEEFDYTAQPSLDRTLLQELATLRFIEEKANALLIGPPGVTQLHHTHALATTWSRVDALGCRLPRHPRPRTWRSEPTSSRCSNRARNGSSTNTRARSRESRRELGAGANDCVSSLSRRAGSHR